MQPVTIIFNTQAGSGKNQKNVRKVIDFFQQNRIEYRLFETLSIGHAVKLAHQAMDENQTHLIVAGGDGTLNEVINGIFSHPTRRDVKIGILPIGTCNDFAQAAGLSLSLDKALETLMSGEPQRFDVAKIADLYFINVAGIGFDVDIVETISRHQKGRNFVTYLLAVFKIIRQYRAGTYRIKTPDKALEGKMLLIAFANGRSFGGGFRIAPMADPQDGLLDIVILKDMPFIKRIVALLRILNGSLDKCAETVTLSSDHISIDAEHPLKMQMEGELVQFTHKEITVDIVGHIKIIVPHRQV
ncbi:YegS/Rv2252/BmrU family lipid kinase [candidate division KSB1 bacterium]|nr:YegS/Rv2252/BmrU family lipid kinase [candidate division KSB1 bacterium]